MRLQMRAQFMVWVHNVNLAGLFGISPIAGFENRLARRQQGKIILMGN